MKRWYIQTVISKLSEAEAFLRNRCVAAARELGADLALAFAGHALFQRRSRIHQGPIEKFLSELPGLEGLLPSYEKALGYSSELIESLSSFSEQSSGDALGLIYEACRHQHLVAKEGSVYTPAWLATELVSKASAANRLVLDPSCGGGIFLLAAFKAGSGEVLPRLSKIHGVDRDPCAVQIARASLLLDSDPGFSPEEFRQAAAVVSANIKLGDTLLDREIFDGIQPFDAVIGNPPYGLSRDERIDPEEKAKLALLYADSRTGKMNKYLLFMARGLELLRAGGRLAFVVPNSWLGIASGEAMRQRLLADGSLLEITAFSGPVFEVPSVEVVTFLAQKEARSERFTVSHRGSSNELLHQFELRAAQCRTNNQSTIPLLWNDGLSDVFESIDLDSIPLGGSESPIIPLIAMQAYARGKGTPPQSDEVVKNHLFDRNAPLEADVYPYLQGSDIQRYRHRHSGSFLKYGPWLAEPQELSRFTGPRIAVREILGTVPHLLIATLIKETALYNKSVLNLLPKPGTSESMLIAILGVLNSRVASLIIACRGNKSQRRLFPKVVNADLKAFPIPRELLRNPEPLAALVQERLACDESNSAALELRIEEEVRRLYKLQSVPDIPTLPESAGSRPASQRAAA